jgi:hypothetical protein
MHEGSNNSDEEKRRSEEMLTKSSNIRRNTPPHDLGDARRTIGTGARQEGVYFIFRECPPTPTPRLPE